MPWTTPRTWVDGELVNAALLNQQVRDNLSEVSPTALAATYARRDQVGAGLSRVLAKLQTGQSIKVALIGDSGLEGTTATTGNAFADKIKATLEARFGVTVTVSNRAVSGYRAYSPLNPGEASPTRFSQALTDDADLYVISFGHNDIRSQGVFGAAYNPGTGYPSAASIASIEHMVRRLRVERPGADIAISNEWQYTGASSASNTVLTPYNNALRRLAAAYGCAFLDYWQALADLGVTGSNATADNTYIHPTGTGGAQHPNDAGHAVWAATLTDQLPADATVPPESPQISPRPLFGADRHTHAGWVAMPAAAGGVRTAGTDGYRLSGSWAGTATLPVTTTTANDFVDVQFIGSEVVLRIDGGAGQGHIKIEIDGAVYNADLDLAPIGTGEHRLPITGLTPGVHRVKVTIVSGSVTVRGFDYLPAMAHYIPYTDTGALTFTGTWAAVGANSDLYASNSNRSTTLNDTVTVEWIGTTLVCNGFGYGSTTHSVGVATDGGTEVVRDIANPSPAANGATSWTVESGIPYGRHTTVIRLNQTGRALDVSAMTAYDERRTERPTSLRGLTRSAAAVKFPAALSAKPVVRLTPDDATSTAPPYPSAVTTTGFTANGTASARHLYEVEAGRVAY